LDGSGRAHASYYDLTQAAVKYAAQLDGAWTAQVVDRAGNVGGETALALDAAGYPHISYHDIRNGALKYARWDGAAWLTETAVAGAGAGLSPDLALDRAGLPHISYYDPASGDLKYARRMAAGWQVQVVEHIGDGGVSSALALDPGDRPLIVFHHVASGSLRLAWWTGKGWFRQEVDRIGSLFPSYVSLALGADGTPQIAYYDVDAGDLKYANGRYPMPMVDWQITTVDSAGDVGGYNSLARSEAGWPGISYVDWTNSTLKYAALGSTGWDIRAVAGIGATGHNSLALDRRGVAHIAFYDEQAADLVLVVQSRDGAGPAGWVTETVDSAGDVGAYASLALDAAGRAWISYYDATTGDLKCAEGEPEMRFVYLPMIKGR
jgi:catechol 2,3-dioxygenase-like lactoylglutathione lyase family enzyme